MERILKHPFLKNLLGNEVRGKWQYSVKKQLFVLGSLIAWILPLAIAPFSESVTGSVLLDYYIKLVGITMVLYGAGKWVDKK